jgi:hypothetical protein
MAVGVASRVSGWTRGAPAAPAARPGARRLPAAAAAAGPLLLLLLQPLLPLLPATATVAAAPGGGAAAGTLCSRDGPYPGASAASSMTWAGDMLKVYHNLAYHNGGRQRWPLHLSGPCCPLAPLPTALAASCCRLALPTQRTPLRRCSPRNPRCRCSQASGTRCWDLEAMLQRSMRAFR